MVAKKRKAPQSQRTTLRHMWLASLGLAMVARREAMALPQRLMASASRLQHTARAQVEPRVVEFSSAVERRLAPVLVKFGLTPPAKPAPKSRNVAGKGPRQVVARKATPATGKGRRRAA